MSISVPNQQAAATEPLIIPDEAIRLRILANSDSEEDQEVKRAIRDAVNEEIAKWVGDLRSIEEAREVILSHLPEVEKIAREEMDARNMDYSVNVDFGHVQFPAKLYGQFLYPAGSYEAILVTLGEGQGANWWCVLFPPLCFLDFSNSMAVSPGFEGEEHAAPQPGAVEQAASEQPDTVQSETENTGTPGNQMPGKDTQPARTKEGQLYLEEPEEQVEVKFFIAELLEKWL